MNSRAASMIFSLHFDDKVAVLDVEEPGSWTDRGDDRHRALLRCDTEDLASLREAYNSLSTLASSFDYVIGFACGALSLIIHIAHGECRRLFGRIWPQSEDELRAIQTRIHVFPGLSWTKHSSAPFVEFLQGIDPKARVLLVDCSFSGGALGKIANAVSSYASALVPVTICGIVDAQRLEEHKIAGCRDLLSRGIIEDFRLLPVRNLLSEDFPKLLGFSSLHKKVELEPLWAPGAIVVHDAETDRCLVQASEPLHAAFSGLLAPIPADAFCVEQSDVSQRAAETLFMVLRGRLQRRYQEIVEQSGSSDATTVLNMKQALCGQWKRETSALKRAFGVDVEPPEPEFCKSIEEEKRFLSGESVDVRVYECGSGSSVVSIRCRYVDGRGAVQTDFSFCMPDQELLQALEQRLSLPAIVPAIYKPTFDVFWKQLADDVKRSLEQRWIEPQGTSSESA
ncbi:hypothetical protein WME76_22710 [Sorangium sp. So ce119]|uniref:hypothetical protein n=1 Tax=Sorangium sp. So ce119 TaxID=3133279 RepID=UPI003F5D727E